MQITFSFYIIFILLIFYRLFKIRFHYKKIENWDSYRNNKIIKRHLHKDSNHYVNDKCIYTIETILIKCL